MKTQSINRREFVRATGLGAAGLLIAPGVRAWSGPAQPFRIEQPFHGAILHSRVGRAVEGGLQIEVSGEAPPGDRVQVNGQDARRTGTRFTSEVTLREKETDITALSDGVSGRRTHRVRVLWDKGSERRYRFSIDDNSFFLRDIARQQYASLFDCFYLKMLRDLHARYQTRFVLNIYYTTADGFDLPQFPDRYRGEWRDNSDWLKLAFHAYANDPDRPYQDAPPAKLIADLEKVSAEIIRFAGESSYSPPTVIHWGMVQPSALKPLRQHGVRVLSGYFEKWNGRWDINYFVDDERSEYLSRHDALMDFESGIIFSKVDMVCNNTPIDRIVPTLNQLHEDPNRSEIIDLFTHEQYFWPFYANYIPDHPQRLDTALRWVTEHGYKPVFLHEGLLGNLS